MEKVKRKYTPEFRADAVRLVLEQGRTVADVARGLDVHVNTLHGWVRAKQERGDTAARRRSPEAEEVARLRRELRRVTEERDILKKAAVDSTDQRNIIRSTSETGDVANGPDGTTGTVRIRESGALGTMEERRVL